MDEKLTKSLKYLAYDKFDVQQIVLKDSLCRF